MKTTMNTSSNYNLENELTQLEKESTKLKEEITLMNEDILKLKKEYNEESKNYNHLVNKFIENENELEYICISLNKINIKQRILLEQLNDIDISNIQYTKMQIKTINSLLSSFDNINENNIESNYLYYVDNKSLISLLEDKRQVYLSQEFTNEELNLKKEEKLTLISLCNPSNQIITFIQKYYLYLFDELTNQKQMKSLLNESANLSIKKDNSYLILKSKEKQINEKYNSNYKDKKDYYHFIISIIKLKTLYNQTEPKDKKIKEEMISKINQLHQGQIPKRKSKTKTLSSEMNIKSEYDECSFQSEVSALLFTNQSRNQTADKNMGKSFHFNNGSTQQSGTNRDFNSVSFLLSEKEKIKFQNNFNTSNSMNNIELEIIQSQSSLNKDNEYDKEVNDKISRRKNNKNVVNENNKGPNNIKLEKNENIESCCTSCL